MNIRFDYEMNMIQSFENLLILNINSNDIDISVQLDHLS